MHTIARALALALLAAAGSAPSLVTAQGAGKASDAARDVGRAAPGEDNSYFHAHALIRLPPATLPPQGQCVVWYPERGADAHSAPQRCRPMPTVEPGGLLIASSKDPAVLEVMAFHAKRPGVVIGRAAFDARTGMLMRALGPDQALDIERPASGARR